MQVITIWLMTDKCHIISYTHVHFLLNLISTDGQIDFKMNFHLPPNNQLNKVKKYRQRFLYFSLLSSLGSLC